MSKSRQPGDSILDAIGTRTGRDVKVALSDVGEEPLTDPRARDFQEQLVERDRDKYQVLGEVARGGMGVVLKGHDRELGRDVAMKVVHEELSDRPEVLQRFVEEAQIGGQLQHPGIVPVYELGLMSDERPYFTMKLVKGHTLAKLLARRKTPEGDRLRFLNVFASVCQTMAYAHAKGVIHRDLKPANVMVGSFGEVQVVDWGLSKVLQRGGIDDELAAQDQARTVIETVRSGPQSGSDSIAGKVLGTPAYMCPEQAQGRVDQLDERADVFALGAILCEILTGAPPYVVEDGGNLVALAARAELDDACGRVDASGAGDALQELCKSCLTPARQARPASAEEVADAVQAHLAGLEVAAHEARVEAAERRVREERARRRAQLALVSGVLIALGGVGWWRVDTHSQRREADLAKALDDLRTRVQRHERTRDYEQALKAAESGLLLLEAGSASADICSRAEQLVADARQAWLSELDRRDEEERNRSFLAFLDDARMRQVRTGLTVDDAELDRRYAAAFADFGLDFESEGLAARVDDLRDTELGIRIALGADSWGHLLRRLGTSAREADRELLNGIALDLDTDELRTETRLALEESDGATLLAIHERLRGSEDAATYTLLASCLAHVGETMRSTQVLVAGADAHPTDYRLNFTAGLALYDTQPKGSHRRAEVYLRAALAIRPDVPELIMTLGDVYRGLGDYSRAYEYSSRAVTAAPDHSWSERTIAFDLLMLGRMEEAIPWLERAAEGVSGPFGAQVEIFHFAADVVLGDKTIDEFVTWIEGHDGLQSQAKWIPAGAILLESPAEGGALRRDPERALELLERALPADDLDSGYWTVLAHAHVLLEQPEAALSALERGFQRINAGNRQSEAELYVLEAWARHQLGDETAAEAALAQAQLVREDLTLGRERGWRESGLARLFRSYKEYLRSH